MLLPDIEETVYKFIPECQRSNIPISRGTIQETAVSLKYELGITAPIVLSDGCITGFMERPGLQTYAMHGETGDVDLDQDIILCQIGEIKAKFMSDPLNRVYNLDETGQASTKIIATDRCAGVKKDNQQITLAPAVNADGSHKLSIYFIGKYKKPRVFQRKTSNNHFCHLYAT